ncbi:MAG: DUF4625 domain-containing protein [Chitinophagaceae bacterium]|nr:DUF4625 domain-containing protein [Chitinophagaceae bacterium]
MTTKQIFSKLSVGLFLFILAFSACKKDKDTVAKPSINNLEIGLDNNKTGYPGSDIHIEGEIIAPGTIASIKVTIHPESGSGWEFDKTYTEGYAGAKNAEFHEHIDIPANAAVGDYHVHIIITDQKGNTTTAEAELKIEQKDPRAALVFTPITGSGIEPHNDHFDGLGGAVEGTPVTVTFDEDGNAISNGHLHLDPDGIYKISLKTYNANGTETQNQYIADAIAAANYKAFLAGGSFILNIHSTNGKGAIFQTRETQYADGTAVSGAVNTTGVTSYFRVGDDNEGEKEVTFIMRKLNTGVKSTITRTDWNRADYATAFAGTNELELKFEIHAEEEHDH